MTLGRRLADQTGSGVGYDPTKQLVFRVNGTNTIVPGTLQENATYNNYFKSFDVLQDPYNFIGPRSSASNGLYLRIKIDGVYTVKLSTASGGFSSDDSYFQLDLDSNALSYNSQPTNIYIESNSSPESSSPYYTTEIQPGDIYGDGIRDWKPNITGDWQFLANDRNPGETPTGYEDMYFMIQVYKAAKPPDTVSITADWTVEITRSDI